MAIKPIHQTHLTDLQKMYRKFWERFNSMSLIDPDFSLHFKIHPIPSIRGYQDYSIGCGYHIAIKLDFRKSEIFIGAYFDNVNLYKEYYQRHRKNIENELGIELKWDEQGTKGSAYYISPMKLETDADWDTAIHKMMTMAVRIKMTFQKYYSR